jgi:hypothetical protein
MAVEIIEHAGTRYAEVIRADTTVDRTTFFSPPESSFQFGLPSYAAGYCETPHYHQPFVRQVDDLQQMFVVQRGIGGVSLYDDLGLVASRLDGATLRRPNAEPGLLPTTNSQPVWKQNRATAGEYGLA